MKRQPAWDKFEVALLVEAYFTIEKDSKKKGEVLQELSNNLRRKAINEGKDIDDTFRNLNGMQWQLRFVKCAFTNSSMGSHRPSKMFCDIVNMYINDRELFNEIVIEAKQKISQCKENNEQEELRNRDERMRKSITEYMLSTSVKQGQENIEKKVIEIVGKKFAYGYRLGSPIEMMKLRTYISEAQLEIRYSDEELELLIRNAGFVTNGKAFVVTYEVENKVNDTLNAILVQGVKVVYYESFIENNREWLESFHVLSEDVLKKLLMKTRKDISYSKNFLCNGEKSTEEISVATEICRVWGKETVISVEELSARLPYIPFEKLRFYLSVNHFFAWVSEGIYTRIETLVVTEKEKRDIIEFVCNECKDKGFASLSNIPLGDIVEQNYELSETAILTSVYNKYLADDYFLNGKILTKEKKEIDVNVLLTQIFTEKEEITLDEALKIVEELTGKRDRRIVYPILYNTKIRIDEQQFISDKAVNFDIDETDEVIGMLIKDRFVAIKEITTFATFPTCGQKWNHYLLESYCYRVSKKYDYRTNLFNGRNAGAIIEQIIDWDYKELLAQAVARSKIRLEENEIGQFLFEVGYMAKSKFNWTTDIAERAKKIREENV